MTQPPKYVWKSRADGKRTRVKRKNSPMAPLESIAIGVRRESQAVVAPIIKMPGAPDKFRSALIGLGKPFT
ncbi:hypothetical protein ACJ72_06945 [Emergomyces africanus]|uniref:Uncharacterized protein n=1 Tax=Emergomyces africanus TaxID=1955775 RepID=A0A1B7NQ46_9EURO|nr:hypothetical protein ACJ72_06945 [Emergomyces africanus]